MPERPGSFVDFETLLALRGDDEGARIERAIADARQAESGSRRALEAATSEAMSNAKRNAGATLGGAASYSDYVAARRKAEATWAQVGDTTGDPLTDSIRAVIRQRNGVDEEVARATAGLSRVEGRRADDVSSFAQASAAARDTAAAEQAKRDAATRVRQQNEDKMRADTLDKMRQIWGDMDKRMGARSAGFAQWTPGATTSELRGPYQWHDVSQLAAPDLARNTTWTGSDAMALAERAKALGLTKEAAAFLAPAQYTWGKRTKGGL